MLGVFITRGLVLILGYAYPAFECYKTVEKNRVEIEELRCWCQYWIIVAMLTAFEAVGDIFISWLPMYGEMKVALLIYLWYPKTKGTGYIYGTFLRPYIAKYEPDIDRNLQELRTRAWDLVIHHCQNCTKLGQTTLVQIITYLAAQPAKFRETKTHEKAENHQHHHPNSAAPPSWSPMGSSSIHGHSRQAADGRPPLPPTHMGVTSRAARESPKSDPVQVHPHDQAEFIHTQRQQQGQPQPQDSPTDESKTGGDFELQAARLRLRRSKGFH